MTGTASFARDRQPLLGTANLLSLSGGSAYDDCDDGEREKNNPQAHFQSDLL
jgi:hypothetical protein